MAETAKKSRIVSDNEENLEEALLEEFNMRLKKCMSQDDLQNSDNPEVHEYDNIEPIIIKSNGIASQEFIRNEQDNYYEAPLDLNREILYENGGNETHKTEQHPDQAGLYIDMTVTSPDNPENGSIIYEDIDDNEPNTYEQPDLTLTLCNNASENEPKSVKDRMLLSTDATPCLLFTQTVTSPMLTPSDENIDFLKGFRKESCCAESNNEPVTDLDAKTEENIYENSEFLRESKHQSAVYENVTVVQVQENIYENVKARGDEASEVIYQNLEDLRKDINGQDVKEEVTDGQYLNDDDVITDNSNDQEQDVTNNGTSSKAEHQVTIDESKCILKSPEIIRQCEKFQSLQESTTQVTESYVETRTIETHSTDKGIKKKKTKKTRKEEKENISVNGTNTREELSYDVNVKNLKSSFSKFDALQKKNVLHVRSSDSSKAQEKFNELQVDTSNCRVCEKPVFQMEQIKAEKAIWHKNCFRCRECNKQLNVDTYESNEGTLYCKPHFKALFAPKVVEDDSPPSDKPDLGLEELQSLNVKERFQVFEHFQAESQEDKTLSTVNIKRSPSILSKLAKFQAKGMDTGIADESLTDIPIEESSTEEEEEDGAEDADLIRARKAQKEKPFHFTGMSDVKSKWEHGEQQTSRDERREERKQEIQTIRNRLFMGKQGKMKEAYQQAVLESESCANVRNKEPIEVCDTKSLKERFEKGELANGKVSKDKDEEDVEVFESEISKKSRSLFLELDANASKAPQITPISTPKVDVKKAREASTPDREVYRDPEVVRSEDFVEDSVVAKESHTATKMLNKFRQLEENLTKETQPTGPKPLKRFTPPPETAAPQASSDGESGSEEETDEEDEGNDEIDRSKLQDEDLIEAQKAARAKQLRAKFERWEANELKKEQNNSSINIIEEFSDEQSQIESTKSLRARFESMRESNNESNRSPRVKVNRFVGLPSLTENCENCKSKVYPLEKICVHNQIYHKNCFKCMECNSVLRMDSYSFNQGNYDSAFGLDRTKEKWNATMA